MSFNLIVPGANFSGLGNPRVESFIAGMPTRNLQALYLFEDGAVGSSPTVITDSSGNGNHAALLAGSMIQKTAQGVTTAHTGAIFTGSIAGSVLTVTSVTAGTIEVGKALVGAGLTNSPAIGSQLSGPTGGTGTYQLTTTPAALSSQAFGCVNNGFLAKTPFLYTGSFSLVIAERNRTPVTGDLASGRYPLLHGAAANASAGGNSMAETFGDNIVSTAGNLQINHDSTNPTQDVAEVGLLNRATNAPNTAWSGASSIRLSRSTGGSPRLSWIVSALSLDAGTGVLTWRSQGNGATPTITDPAQVATWINAVKGNGHLFGFGKYLGNNVLFGDVGMAGFYNVSKNAGELDVLIAAAKARMALRGVAAL